MKPDERALEFLVWIMTHLRRYQKAYFKERSLADLQRAKVWESRADEWLKQHGEVETKPLDKEPEPQGPQQGSLFE